MKKIYTLVAVVLLVVLIFALSIIKNNNTMVSTEVSKIYQSTELFTDRDLEQNVNTTSATNFTVTDENDIIIDASGTYKISGTAKNVTIYVEAEEDEKVQLVLENLSITNETMPCIYIKTVDKIFVNLQGTNTLKTIGTFASDGSTNLNGVIFSKQDITLNGTGILNIESTQNGITGKDDVKITGGTFNIKADGVAIRANDSIRISDGVLNLNAGTDGLHSENSSDDTKGYIFICDGQINIEATDDGIHGESVVQIDGGKISIEADEAIEGTYIQINGGTIEIDATSDGINAGRKSESFNVTIEITGGEITISMADGDTDGVDSNGDIIISGGNINIKGNCAFDYDGTATYTGGTITINGTQVNEIIKQDI